MLVGFMPEAAEHLKLVVDFTVQRCVGADIAKSCVLCPASGLAATRASPLSSETAPADQLRIIQRDRRGPELSYLSILLPETSSETAMPG